MSQLVLLTCEGELGENFAALLQQSFPDIVIIMEEGVKDAEINRHRRKKFGTGYIWSEKCASLLRKIIGRALKSHRLAREVALNLPQLQKTIIHRVENVNSLETIALLQANKPQAVAVFSTRLLKPATLSAANLPFINYHCGINPLYRGQFPLYWARALQDEENVGVTVHLVDEGIDTGDILYQEKLTFRKKDISAFHFKQALPIGARLMSLALQDALQNTLKPFKRHEKSQIFYPPTLGQYIYYGLTKNIW